MELRDKVVIVTGGASGIGAALARAFLAEGAAVIAADLHSDGVPNGCEGRACDVTSEAAVVQLVRETEARHGRVDVFCSNVQQVQDHLRSEIAKTERPAMPSPMPEPFSTKPAQGVLAAVESGEGASELVDS